MTETTRTPVITEPGTSSGGDGSTHRGPLGRLRTTRRRRAGLVLACAAGLVVLFAATTVVSWQRAQEQVALARSQAVEAAQQQAVALLSYDHRSIDADLDRARSGLTGPFREEYAKLTSEVIAPVAKEQRTTTRANVVRSAVVNAEQDRAVVLLFLNQTTESNTLEAPRIDGSRVRMTLKNVDDRWLVSDLAPV